MTINQDIESERAAHAATKAELQKAKRALTNPAFADAGIRGLDAPTPEGAGRPVGSSAGLHRVGVNAECRDCE